MSCDARFSAARIRIDNVTCVRTCAPATISAAQFVYASSEIRAVLSDFPVLRFHSTTALCTCLSAASDFSAVSAAETALLIDALLSGAHASDAELDLCAALLGRCLRDRIGSVLDTLILYIAANCTDSVGCGYFFFSVLQGLAEDGESRPEDDNLEELFCRCDTTLQKFEERRLAQRWLNARTFLREWQIKKIHRQQIMKGFGFSADSSALCQSRIERRLSLLPFYAKEGTLLRLDDEANKAKRDLQKYLPWNARLGESLNFLMAMYIVRPEFIYRCLWRLRAVQTVVCAILTEFDNFNLQQHIQPSASIQFPIAKCIFLTYMTKECEGAVIFRPLPGVLLAVSEPTDIQSEATMGLKSLQLSTVVNLYLTTLVEPTSAMTATVADLRLLVKALFAASVYSGGRLMDVLSENLTAIPATFVQEAIEEVFTHSNSTHTTHLMMFKVIQELVPCFPNVREAFLETLGNINFHFSHIYKGVAISFPGEEREMSGDGRIEESRINALLTLLRAMCDTAVFAAERCRESKMLHRTHRALRQIERHFTWLLVKFSRSPRFPLLVESWTQLHDCKYGMRLQKASANGLATTSNAGTSAALVCRCGAMRIAGCSQRHRLGVLTSKCCCVEPAWCVPELPDIRQWMTWEMHFESCIALRDHSDDRAGEIPADNPLWTAWAKSLQTKSMERPSSVQNEVVKSMFQGILHSQAVSWQTFKTGPLSHLVRIPAHVCAVLRSITGTSSFSSISWLYSALQNVIYAPDSNPKQRVSSNPLKSDALRLLFKQCIEQFLVALPKRHLFPLCSVNAIPWSEIQNAEWGIGVLFSGKHEREECVTDFPRIAYHTGHLGNAARSLYANSGSLPRLAMLGTYVNAHEHSVAESGDMKGLAPTKERIISTFFINDEDSEDSDG